MSKPVVNEPHDAQLARPVPPKASASRSLRKIEGLSARADQLPCSVALHTTDGATVVLGKDVPAVDVFVRNKNGMRALASLNELAITEAYMRQDIDRLNYHLWAKKELARWIEQKSKVNEIAGEATWRMFAILIAATASIMDRPSHSHSAYRMVLELPADAVSIAR